MWLSNFLEKDKVLRTKREIRWRRVQLNRSIKFVLPLSLPTVRCLELGITCSYDSHAFCVADRTSRDIRQLTYSPVYKTGDSKLKQQLQPRAV
jgi:hypothetical protein